MKKFLLTLLILLGLGSLTACQLNFDPVYGEHEHEITGEFGYYEQIHWNICATCDEKVDKAWHNFGPWQRVSDDSLEERRTCLCGYYETRFHSHSLTGNVLYDDNEHYEECEKCFDHVNAVAHTYGEWTVGRESTEDVQGYELQVCSCGHTVYRSLPLKNHVHVWDGTYSITEDAHWKNCVKESCTMDEVDLLVPHNGGQATCTEDAVCVDCGYHYEEAFGHDYESVVTNPTCTEKGYTTHTCKKGDHTYVDGYVDALGHDYNSVVTAPTCTEDGYTTYTCKNDATHTYVGDEVAATGHDYEGVVTAPTCEDKGYTTYTCKNDATHTYVGDEVAATGHTEVIDAAKAATCIETGLTEGKHCSVCKDILVAQQEVPALGHSESTTLLKDDTYHWNPCVRNCGLQYNKNEHSGDLGTDENSLVCEVCECKYGFSEIIVVGEQGFTDKEAWENVTISGENTSIVVDKENSSTKPVYYDNEKVIRFYSKNSLTVSALEGYGIVKIVVTTTSGNKFTESNTGIINGSCEFNETKLIVTADCMIKDVCIFNSASSGNARIISVQVLYKKLTDNETLNETVKHLNTLIPNPIKEKFELPLSYGEYDLIWSSSDENLVVGAEGTDTISFVPTLKETIQSTQLTLTISANDEKLKECELEVNIAKYVTSIEEALTAESGSVAVFEGTVASVDYKWSTYNKNMSVTLTDGTNTIYVYKLATKVYTGDVIKVSGTVTTYNSVNQIAEGATATIISESYKNSTIADALDEYIASGDIYRYNLTGVVSKITSVYSSSYNNISFDLVDGTGVINVYRCTGGETLVVGETISIDNVVLSTYSGNYQVAQGSVLVSNEVKEISDEIKVAYAKSIVSKYGDDVISEDKTLASSIELFDGTSVVLKWKDSEGSDITGIIYNNPSEITTISTIAYFTIGEVDASVNVDFVLEAFVANSKSISFADTANRTAFTTSQQVWEQNGITVTNDKSSSTSNVANYSNPARFYANSSITVSYTSAINSIVVTCNAAKYAKALANSITSGASVTVSGSICTITLDEASTSFTIATLSAQVRVDSLVVNY